ncbi:hypothetical protein BIW11_08017 [Tropilaelaps mercedesae]|uniref:Hsp70-binding protein 1-like n=1 Tax=Tropilaelaps mercedesae TaxID=418985 RepID=A0A1V9XRP6_9ACAR|nr:hypothetical protein BIW11_08017 [Tropilaelaps mercedesae]
MTDQSDILCALRFAVSQIQAGCESTGPMNEQDCAWLSKVLNEMAGWQANNSESCADDNLPQSEPGKPKGISGVLSGLVDLIKDEKKPHNVDTVKNKLQHIAEDGELLDKADDGDRRKAVAPIAVLLTISCPTSDTNSSSEPALRDMIAPLCSILAELAQNSPQCQEEALALIPRLIAVAKSDGDAAVKTKAVYALSGILRGNQSSLATAYLLPKCSDDTNKNREDEDDGALDVLVKLVLTPKEAPPVRIKAAFLLCCLAEQRHDVRQLLSRRYEKDIEKLQEMDANVKELLDRILKRIHTNKTDEGKAPLALAM